MYGCIKGPLYCIPIRNGVGVLSQYRQLDIDIVNLGDHDWN